MASDEGDAVSRAQEAAWMQGWHQLAIDNLEKYAIFVTDTEGVIQTWHKGVASVLGYDETTFKGRHVSLIFTQNDVDNGIDKREMANAARDGRARDERWHVKADGTRFWATGIMFALRGEDGGLAGFAKLLRDETIRHHNEVRMRESEERHRVALQAGNLGTWELDLEHNTVSWDERCRILFGFPDKKEVTFANAMGAIHPEDRARVEASLAEATAPDADGSYQATFRTVWPDGSVHWVVSVALVHFRGKGTERQARRIIGTNADITAQKRAEDDLALLNLSLHETVEERTQEVRSLAAQLTLAEQLERERLGQVLHDELQQNLYAAQMLLQRARRQAEAAGESSLGETLEEAYGLLLATQKSTRSFIAELNPAGLTKDTLLETLQWLGDQAKSLHALEVTVVQEGEVNEPPEATRLMVFRLVRELLFNVVKHAGVREARVSLCENEERLEVEVSDAGRGLEPVDLATLEQQGTGFGLSRVRERVSLFGGEVEVDSTPGKGTRVRLFLPNPATRRHRPAD